MCPRCGASNGCLCAEAEGQRPRGGVKWAAQTAVSVEEGDLARLLPRLRVGELDLSVGRLEPGYASPDLLTEALYEEPMAIVARPDHRQSCPASRVRPLGGGCGSRPRYARVFSMTGRSRKAAMIVGSPAPQFGHLFAAVRLTGRFCHSDTPMLADCCLVPQIVNAQRFDCRLGGVPRVMQVFVAGMELPAFRRAAPMVQPDAGE